MWDKINNRAFFQNCKIQLVITIHLNSNIKSSTKKKETPPPIKRLCFSWWEQGDQKTYLLLPLLVNSSPLHRLTHTHTFLLVFSEVRQLLWKAGFFSPLVFPDDLPLTWGPGLSTQEEHEGEQCCKFVAQSVKIPPGMLICPFLPTHTHFNNPQPRRLRQIGLPSTTHSSLSSKLPIF